MSNSENFLKALLDLMNKRMDGLEQKIDDNTATTNKTLTQAQYTNGRVTKLEKQVADKKANQMAGKMQLSPKVIYLIAVGAVILLLIVATMLGVPLKGLSWL